MADGDSGSVYIYAPNKGAAIFFAVAYAGTGLFHLWQCFHYKSWGVTALLPFCGALLTGAFAARSYGAFHDEDPQVYTASLLLIYASTPIVGLANYIVLTRLFYFVPYFAPMHPARMLVTFATLTAFVELPTLAGIGYLTNQDADDKSIDLGRSLIRVSLVVQLVITGTFFLLGGAYHICCVVGKISNPRVTRPLLVSYASMLLVFGRTIYRTVEQFSASTSGKGQNPQTLNPIVRYEWYFLVFDATFILLAMVLWNLAHPGRFLPDDPRMYLAQNGVTVVKGPGWKDSRPITETLFNPFAMLGKGNGHQNKFWEHNGYNMELGSVRRTRR